MLLCFDVGNTHLHIGLFDKNNNLAMQFRYSTESAHVTSDQMGVFFRQAIVANGFLPENITAAAIASVVPSLNYSLRASLVKYFKIDPFFIKSGIKTSLKIKYDNPLEIGADIIAANIAVLTDYPKKNAIILDLGTATVINPLTENGEFLGGSIITGIRSSLESLAKNASQLSSVPIIHAKNIIGKNTISCIQSGLYFGALGSIKEIINRMCDNLNWNKKDTLIIATGGFSYLFKNDDVFNIIQSNLVLKGILYAYIKNNTGF